MEELLNKLIEKGWKPRNKEEVKRLNYHTLYREVVSLEFDNYNLGVSYSIRDLVSKESGLWQFVCENKLRNPIGWDYHRKQGLPEEIFDEEEDYMCDEPEYRIIESALKDESELEKFLLDNIKI